MNSLFTPDVIEQLKIKIRQSMQDTACFMFNLDLATCSVSKGGQEAPSSKAYVMLSSPESVSYLQVSIPNFIAQKLAAAIGAGDLPEEAMMQDITCEVTNIVAHAVQAYFSGFPAGDRIEVGMPQIGDIDKTKTANDVEILRLSAPDGSADPVVLDFVFSKSA